MFYAVAMPPDGFLGMPQRYKSSLHFNWYKGLFEKLKLVLGAENLAGVGERYQLAVETSSVVYSISRTV